VFGIVLEILLNSIYNNFRVNDVNYSERNKKVVIASDSEAIQTFETSSWAQSNDCFGLSHSQWHLHVTIFIAFTIIFHGSFLKGN